MHSTGPSKKLIEAFGGWPQAVIQALTAQRNLWRSSRAGGRGLKISRIPWRLCGQTWVIVSAVSWPGGEKISFLATEISRAKLVFVGEGPGFEEDQQGLPFVGPAGQLLTRIIEAIKLDRTQVYICNVIKCRPPGNRNPQPDEINACFPFLERQLASIQPDFIVALGTFAAQTLLGTATPISRLRRRFHDYNGIKVLPTYHPAYLLRNPDKKRDVWEDMKMLMKEYGHED